MGKPARKRCYAEAKATRKGQLQAEWEAQRKKPLTGELKTHLGNVIDNLKIDPLEIAAVIGLALAIKPILDTNVDLKGKMDEIAKAVGTVGLQASDVLHSVTDAVDIQQLGKKGYVWP